MPLSEIVPFGHSLIMDCFSIGEVLKLLQVARKESEQDWLLLAVTFIYAMRASEAVGLKGDSIVGDYLVRRRGKGSKPIRRPLLAHRNKLLNVKKPLLILSKIRGNQRLFPMSARTFQRRVHKYGELAGLPELLCHPHTLKHAILSHLAETMTLPELQQVSGHKSLGSLGVYLHPKSEKVERKFGQALGGV